MSEITPPRPRDCALAEKASLRAGLELAGLSRPQLADLLGVDDDVVESWCRPDATAHVPAWIARHPRCPRVLRDFLRAEQDRAAGTPSPHGAETPEQQARVVLCAAGQLVSALAAAGDTDHYGPELAAQLSRVVERVVTASTALAARLRQRAVTGRTIAARGQS